jgi:ABC-type branched-subunit amino acid transport system permease subunit
VRENEEAAGAIGIDAFRVKVIAMIISGAIAGAAGVAYLQIQLFIDAPIAYGSLISVEALLGPIIGGAGTLLGPIVGTIVLHVVGEVVKNGSWRAGPQPCRVWGRPPPDPALPAERASWASPAPCGGRPGMPP